MNPNPYLSDLELHGVKLGLDNIRSLLAALGNPETRFPAIHIAGTNGKGSVAAMVDTMFRRAGYRVGRFTSPHLIDVRERFTCSGELITEAAFEAAVDRIREAAASRNLTPTYFEATTAVAFQWFADMEVDAAVVEVGMGGRFDSTNVCHPIACAITPVDLDHIQYLGDTLAKIAFEKAGILKTGVPAVVSHQAPEALEVIQRQADTVGAPLRICGEDFTYAAAGTALSPIITFRSGASALGPQPLSLAGAYQPGNAAVAIELARLCAPGFPNLTDSAILEGLASTSWPCRVERVLDRPPVYIDVAHNPAGAAELSAVFDRAIFVLGVSADKDAAGMLRHLAPKAAAIIATEYTGRRAMAAAELAALAPDGLPVTIAPNLEKAIATGLVRATDTTPLVITGSVFTAGEARDLLTRTYGAPYIRF